MKSELARKVFRNVNLVDGDSAAKPGHGVVVEGNRIAEVGPVSSIAIRPGDEVYDLEGRTLMPGMTQGHWHGSYENIPFIPRPGGLEHHPSYMAFLALKNAQLALAHGYTSLIGAATGECLDAQLKRAINDGVVEGPRITACGHWLITTGDVGDYDEHWWWGISALGVQRICDGPEEFAKSVRQEIKEGAEVIKIFSDQGHLLREGGMRFITMTKAETAAVVDTAHSRGAKVRSHICSKQGILDGIELGIDLFDHADGLDQESLDKMLAAGRYMCPSIRLPQAVVQHFAAATQQRAFNAEVREAFESMSRMLVIAAKAGLKVMVGDDWGTWLTPHGDYGTELKLYAEIGIPAIEIIRWATKHPAQFVGMERQLGKIAPDMLADLLVVDGDPLADIAILADRNNILAVMKDGKFYRSSLTPQTGAAHQRTQRVANS